MVQFLDPEIAKIPQFMDPEIVNMDKKNYGSINRRNGAISGSRNCRKGRKILYGVAEGSGVVGVVGIGVPECVYLFLGVESSSAF